MPTKPQKPEIRSIAKELGLKRLITTDADLGEPTITDDTHGLPFAVRQAVERAPPVMALEPEVTSDDPDSWTEDEEHILLLTGRSAYLPEHTEKAYKTMAKRARGRAKRGCTVSAFDLFWARGNKG